MDETQKTKVTEASEVPVTRRSARQNALFLPTFAGCLVGMLVGTLPAAVWLLIFHFSFSPMYAFLPLLIYLGNKIFRGYTGRRGIIAVCVFSAVGFYLTLLSVEAAVNIILSNALFLTLPLLTVAFFGQSGVLTGHAFSSAYVFPAVFTLFGILLASELLRERKPVPQVQEQPADAL